METQLLPVNPLKGMGGDVELYGRILKWMGKKLRNGGRRAFKIVSGVFSLLIYRSAETEYIENVRNRMFAKHGPL